MLGLIDADYIAYLGAFASQDKYVVVKRGDKILWRCKNKTEAIESIESELDLTIDLEVIPKPLQLGHDKIDNTISSILYNASLDSHRLFLSGSNNFRKDIVTLAPYKGTRPPKPVHLDKMREYMFYKGAEAVDHLEADDLVSHYQTSLEEDTMIISDDKDLETVPGILYKPSKKKLTTITPDDALYNFYYQMLIGDATDNIPSPKGLGKVTAKRILDKLVEQEGSPTALAYYDTVKDAYEKFLGKHKVVEDKKVYNTYWYAGQPVDDILWEVGNLLYMHRTLSEEERWEAPVGV